MVNFRSGRAVCRKQFSRPHVRGSSRVLASTSRTFAKAVPLLVSSAGMHAKATRALPRHSTTAAAYRVPYRSMSSAAADMSATDAVRNLVDGAELISVARWANNGAHSAY
eukprot:TRINITY_DN2100_c0_g1_i2.p6 TRINITY_DN2100_c0_g1~~TRINITY_DN2100_c0_g1_i2.p6  ORF type:complete len:110 (+),score=8.18 TRINITY_DN2100_c0_g1_i2:423-752(+)